MRALSGMVALALVLQPAPIFAFKTDGFWLNLHSFLYVLGRDQNRAPDRTRAVVAGAPDDQNRGLTSATSADAQAWRDAVGIYAAGPSRLDAVFDAGMIDLTTARFGGWTSPRGCRRRCRPRCERHSNASRPSIARHGGRRIGHRTPRGSRASSRSSLVTARPS